MLDRIENKAVHAAEDSASKALHEEAMPASASPSGKAFDSNSAKASATLPEKKGAMSASEQRKADETRFFHDFYEKHNLELDPMQKGQTPLQSLEQMEKEGKIKMSEEDMQAQAKRISAREAKAPGRSSFTPADHVKFWSEEEINKLTQEMVAKPKGIDVSNWQGKIDWNAVKNAGYEFAFMKATQGNWFIDKTFDADRQGAKDAGLKLGYYHYFEPGVDPDAQAKFFCDKIGKVEPDALRLVIDAEGDGWMNYSADQRVAMVDQFLKGVQNRVGMKPEVCIYCSPNFADEVLLNSPKLKDYSLWIANYGVNEPHLPRPWDKWDFWQYTSSGSVPGINGRVDLDVYNGSEIKTSD